MAGFDVTDFVNRHNAGVIQGCGCRGFGHEALQIRVARQATAKDHLDCDFTVQRSLAGTKNHAHAATTDFFQQIKVADGCRQPKATPTTR